MEKLIYLVEVKDVLERHKLAILSGGHKGLFPDAESKINGIIAQQYPKFGHDEYPNLALKISMVTYFLIKDHVFPDGNKRTGLLTMMDTLERNNIELLLDEEELYRLIIEIANSEPKIYKEIIIELSNIIIENSIDNFHNLLSNIFKES